MGDKAALRTEVRRRRAGLPAPARARATRRATAQLLELPEIAGVDRIAMYASHGDELATDEAMTALVARGVRVLLPRVAGRGLELVAVAGDDQLRPGFRGVREPSGPAVAGDEVEAIVVPGVAFDRRGNRLGQGGGHYDRLLTQLPPRVVRVGYAFALQLVEQVPSEAHDEPVDVVVTETEVVRTGARADGAAG